MIYRILFILLFASSLNAQFIGGHGALWKASAEEGLKNSLLACWEMDETSGTNVSDSHTAGKDGTLTGGTIGSTGHIDKAIDYTGGTSDKVTIPTGVSYDFAEWSCSIWFKVDNLTGTKGLFSHWYAPGNRSNLIRLSASAVQWYSYTSAQIGGTFLTVSTATWYHVVCVYNGSTMRVYLDGTLDATSFSQTGNTGETGDNSAYIGNYFTTPSNENSHDGLIDQVATWSRALTQDDVDDLYNSGSGLAYSSW